jgi:hypothetical protein
VLVLARFAASLPGNAELLLSQRQANNLGRTSLSPCRSALSRAHIVPNEFSHKLHQPRGVASMLKSMCDSFMVLQGQPKYRRAWLPNTSDSASSAGTGAGSGAAAFQPSFTVCRTSWQAHQLAVWAGGTLLKAVNDFSITMHGSEAGNRHVSHAMLHKYIQLQACSCPPSHCSAVLPRCAAKSQEPVHV